jgi:hypothetical protein
MADSPTAPSASWPGDEPVAARPQPAARAVLAAVAAAVAIAVASALLGLLAGYVWAAVAPHVLIVAVGPGGPDVVNPETSAFIVADGWFAAICALGGAVCGLLGWLVAVRRSGPLAVAGLLAGGVAAGFAARWVGQRSGRASFAHQLAASKTGALLHAPLTLGASGAIAFWPLAAALTVGGIELAGLIRERRARPPHPGGRHAAGQAHV